MEAPPAIAAKFGPIAAAMGQGVAQLVAAAEGAVSPPHQQTH